MLISIIIPALNEAACIEHTLQSLQQQQQPFEVIVVDGGSRDETVEIARQFAQVICAERGRANQMNAGAAASKGELLLFLHADSQLPPNGLALVRQAVDQEAQAGTFRLQFDNHSPLLGFYSFFTRFNFPKFSFGDRGLFVRTSLFQRVGGFAPIPIFEDLDIVKRLSYHGAFVFLSAYVTTAARRFERYGFLKQQLLNGFLWIKYVLGSPPEKLADRYKYNSSA